MIQLRHLNLIHLKDLKELVHDLSICINNGDKVAIIGDEGNGKSTLLNYLVDDTSVQEYIKIEGEKTDSFQTRQYLPQIFEEDETSTLSEFFFSDENVNYHLLYRFADELGFDSRRFDSSQKLGSLSGGEKIKIQLIKKLSYDAELILLDEPSNDLDLRTVKWLEKFIKNSSQTIIFVSHDEYLLENVATKVIHLELIKKRRVARTSVHSLDYVTYIHNREQHYQKEIKEARKEKLEFAKKIQKHNRQRHKVESALRACHDSSQGRLLAKKMKNLISHEKRYEKEEKNLTEIPIKEEVISLTFQNSSRLNGNFHFQLEVPKLLSLDFKTVLSNHIKIDITKKDRIGIIGDNGVGKTRLLMLISEELRKVNNLKVGYMPQHYDEVLNLSCSSLEFFSQYFPTVESGEIITKLACLNFSVFEMKHIISELSGGQIAKLTLLKLILEEPDILLLDEPTRNFSPLSQPELRRLFCSFEGPIITVSHDRKFLTDICQTVYCLDKNGFERVKENW